MNKLKPIYARLTGADEQDVEPEEPRNGAIQTLALTFTKAADNLIDPKLVISWLLGSLGAPGAFIGWLVPIREAGSLLPQVLLAKWVANQPLRKVIWAAGSMMQGIAAIGVGTAALMLEGAAAGWAILSCLAALAIARSLCSLSHKDTLARSIPKTRRGAVSGAAGAFAAAVALAFGAALATGVVPLTAVAISVVILLAGALWLIASAIFLALKEKESDEKQEDGEQEQSLIAPLLHDRQLQRFILARAMLTVTALAPPFLVMMTSAASGAELGTLGPLMIASSLAGILSSYVWGRLSDRSSRRTMIYAAALSATTLGSAAAMGLATGGLGGLLGASAALFVSQIAYEGVRQGRKLHLTDMTSDETRARYTAVSNTAIGVVLIAGGAFGLLSNLIGPAGVVATFAAIALSSIPVLAGLEEIQKS